MPLETVTVTIGGANPQTKTVQVNVNAATGTGSATLQYNGTNGGLDTIKATSTIAGNAYTSNTGNVAWQQFPAGAGACIGPVAFETFKNPGDHETWHGVGISFGVYNGHTVIYNQPVNNTPIFGIVDPNGRTGEYRDTIPMWANETKADGTALGGTNWPGVNLGHTGHSFVEVMQFKLIVRAASTNPTNVTTFYFLVDDAWAFYVGGGATRYGGSSNSMVLQPNGSSPQTPSTYNGLNLMGTRNTPAQAVQPTDTVQVKFPKPGIYDCVLWWVNNDDDQGYFQMTATAGAAAIASSSGTAPGTVLLPVSVQANAPATTPSGNLQVSIPSGVAPLIANSDTASILITVTGIVYSTEPYIPLLEGTQGKLFIYNDPNNPVFTYPTYNGQPVDKSAAVTAKAINLSGDNSSWVGRLLPAFNDGGDGQFSLKYNGSGFDSHVDVTHLTVNADDVSWFDATDKSFDLYTITAGNGGLQKGITVDYMVSVPAANCTVTPSSVPADGQSHTFTLALPKPVSPRQQGTQFGTGNTFTISGVSVGANAATNVSPIIDAQGWLTGWNITAVVTHSTSNGSVNVTGTISGTLTRLSGTTFVTGTVTYASGALGNAVSTVGVSFSPPTNYSFTPPSSFSGSITLTATVFATDSGSYSTFNFLRQLSGTNTVIGAGTKTSGPTAVSGGFTTTFSITTTSTFAWGSPIHFGYTATDALSGLSLTYISGTSSTNLNSAPGGGGGGGGCFTAAVGILTASGYAEFGDLPKTFEIVNQTGTHMAELVVHENYKGWMIELAPGKLVTLGHMMQMGTEWLAAEQMYPDHKRVWFEGTVYNMHVLSDDPADKHYILWNGDVAHNLKYF